NAVLPVALAGGCWPEAALEGAWLALAAPGTYGKLRPLAGWLGGGAASQADAAAPAGTAASGPFTTAARLQGGLLLHSDYCTRGACGRCPFS
ncbi:MAG: hypothetical protein ACRDG3_11265, partial [Tepidiformaceae bacterium]